MTRIAQMTMNDSSANDGEANDAQQMIVVFLKMVLSMPFNSIFKTKNRIS